jgi:hypothetical protein
MRSTQSCTSTSDSTVVSPSIALLQERFKHLEKVKERREEKELLKLFSETERFAPTMHFEPSKLSSFPQGSTSLQDSLSLGRLFNSQTTKQDDHLRAMKMQPLTNLSPNGAATASSSRSSENSDVDTSLHL